MSNSLHEKRINQGYDYDHVKRFYYRALSTCCNTTTTQRMLYKGKTPPKDFTLTTGKTGTVHDTTFRQFCDNCHEQTKLHYTYIFKRD